MDPMKTLARAWLEWRNHDDAIGLFVKLAVELKRLMFGGCSEKIYRVHSAKVQLVGLVEPVICESFISKYLYGFSRGTLVNSEVTYHTRKSPLLICSSRISFAKSKVLVTVYLL